MPLLVVLLLIVLVAMFGFWDTLQAIAGGIAILILLGLAAVALVAGLAYRLFRRSGERL